MSFQGNVPDSRSSFPDTSPLSEQAAFNISRSRSFEFPEGIEFEPGELFEEYGPAGMFGEGCKLANFMGYHLLRAFESGGPASCIFSFVL